MQHEIKGNTTPILEITLAPGDEVIAESGELAWMSRPGAARDEHGRRPAEERLPRRREARDRRRHVLHDELHGRDRNGLGRFRGEGARARSSPIQVGGGREYVVHRHGFVCCEPGVELNLHMQQKIGAGIFGGAGFILQRLSGQGLAFVEMTGDVVEIELARGRRVARSSGPRCALRRVDQRRADDGARHQEQDLRRRRAFPRPADRSLGRVWLQSISMAVARRSDPAISRDGFFS